MGKYRNYRGYGKRPQSSAGCPKHGLDVVYHLTHDLISMAKESSSWFTCLICHNERRKNCVDLHEHCNRLTTGSNDASMAELLNQHDKYTTALAAYMRVEKPAYYFKSRAARVLLKRMLQDKRANGWSSLLSRRQVRRWRRKCRLFGVDVAQVLEECPNTRGRCVRYYQAIR
jgi:hypothetical protein